MRWKCGARTAPVTGIVADASKMKAYLSIYDFESDVDLLREVLPMAIRQHQRVVLIKPRFSKTEGGSKMLVGRAPQWRLSIFLTPTSWQLPVNYMEVPAAASASEPPEYPAPRASRS